MLGCLAPLLVVLIRTVPVRAETGRTAADPSAAKKAEVTKPKGIVVAIIGLILLGSIVWMGCLIARDRERFRRGDVPERMVVPMVMLKKPISRCVLIKLLLALKTMHMHFMAGLFRFR